MESSITENLEVSISVTAEAISEEITKRASLCSCVQYRIFQVDVSISLTLRQQAEEAELGNRAHIREGYLCFLLFLHHSRLHRRLTPQLYHRHIVDPGARSLWGTCLLCSCGGIVHEGVSSALDRQGSSVRTRIAVALQTMNCSFSASVTLYV